MSVTYTSDIEKEEILDWLKEEDSVKLEALYSRARKVKKKCIGNKVYLRGLIELSNICQKDCYYCGIRKSNEKTSRYIMRFNEIIKCVKKAHGFGFGSVVLQSGERQDDAFVDFIESVILETKKVTDNGLRITLSLGEQSHDTLKRWYKSGAERYLIRIETTNKSLYKKVHPSSHDFDERLQCLKDLKSIGYQVGTGFLIGLTGQSEEDLYSDLMFLKEQDIDMIGMGPYIVHKETPLGKGLKIDKDRNFNLGLKMIALARIILKDVNIASTTALETLMENGRELGLMSGANVIMPNITPQKYLQHYSLYENKTSLNNENIKEFEEVILKSGMSLAYFEEGDSAHYLRRTPGPIIESIA